MKNKIFALVAVALFQVIGLSLVFDNPTIRAADKKITDLTADANPTSDDLVETVHDPAGTPASRKATLANITKGLAAASETVQGVVTTGDQTFAGTKTLTAVINGVTLSTAEGDTKVLLGDGTYATLLTTIPDASAISAGKVSTGSQTFAGVKTFNDAAIMASGLTISSSNLILGGGATASRFRLLEASGSGSNYTEFVVQPQAGNITYTLPADDGDAGEQLQTDGSGNLTWESAGSGITTLNTLSGATQTFATGTAGTDFAISSAGTTHTFNLPDASATARGLVTTGTQTFAGTKTISGGLVVTPSTPGGGPVVTIDNNGGSGYGRLLLSSGGSQNIEFVARDVSTGGNRITGNSPFVISTTGGVVTIVSPTLSGTTTANGAVNINSPSAAAVPLSVKLAATPTGNALEVNSSAGSGGDLASISASGATVLNESGNDADFRVEGDTVTNLLATDAGTDTVIIGGGTGIKKVLSASATLDFPDTAAGSVADLTITVTGAADGDVVALGESNASRTATGAFDAWVSAADTVTVRFIHSAAGNEDPASGTFRVMVTKF